MVNLELVMLMVSTETMLDEDVDVEKRAQPRMGRIGKSLVYGAVDEGINQIKRIR